MMENEITQIIANAYFIILTVISVYFFLFCIANFLEMKLHTYPAEEIEGPLVSVCIPARNEEKNIGACLLALCEQTYKNYEIIVLDDNSSDKTFEIAQGFAQKYDHIKVMKGKPLPPDWYGKPYAEQQLSEEARGDILLFSDADCKHNKSSVSWAVSNLKKNDIDFLTGYTRQRYQSFGEIITVPLMFLLTAFVIPLFLNRYTKTAHYFSAAIGQYIAVKTKVFKDVGGYTAVKQKTSEDIYLARYIKTRGYKTMFLDMGDQVECKMYSGYLTSLVGIGKNIFDFFGKVSAVLFLVALAVIFFLFLPFPLLIYCIATGSPHLSYIITVNVLYTLTWVITFLRQRQPWYFGLLWPILYLNYVYVSVWSWWRTISGRGFTWKDRKVT
jgi:chlorobactene glucosyltransferase